MRVKETKLYKYSELSENAQEKAREWYRDGALDYEWWDSVYEDAENIGIKITEFDLDRNRYTKGKFILSATEIAANIIRDHGNTCETYKTAENFLDSINSLTMPESDSDEIREWENNMLELEDEFQKSILEDYSILLQHEFEYLMSDEAISESIIANEYEFTDEGRIF